MTKILEVPLEPCPATVYRAFVIDPAQRELQSQMAPLGFRSLEEQRRFGEVAALADAEALIDALLVLPRPCMPAVERGLRPLPDGAVLPAVARGLASLRQVASARRVVAAEVLCSSLLDRGPGAVGVLVDALPGLPPAAVARAGVVLGTLGGSEAVGPLLAAADRLSHRPADRRHAIGALWGLHALDSAACLQATRQVYDLGARWPAVLGLLWRHGQPEDVARLTPLLAGLQPPGPVSDEDWPAEALGFSALMALYGLARRIGLGPFLLEVAEERDRQGLVAWFAEQPPEAAEVSFRATYNGVARGTGERSWTWLRDANGPPAVLYAGAVVPLA
ncbi:MAG: hypothetical protein R3F60_30835 [bacterium]